MLEYLCSESIYAQVGVKRNKEEDNRECMGGREYFPLLASLLDQFHSLIGKYLLITFSVPGTHTLMGHPQLPSDAENLLGPHWK